MPEQLMVEIVCDTIKLGSRLIFYSILRAARFKTYRRYQNILDSGSISA